MLQTQTISKECLELLNKIMKSEVFSDFILVGRTALALQLGHRNSVDLDLFGYCEIDEILFINELKKFGKVKLLNKTKNILTVSVNNIKVDVVNYTYSFLDQPIFENTVRIVTKKDIAAMKLNAISGRGSRKDFIDLYFLLKFFSLDEMIRFYDDRYEEGSYMLVLKSLSYFEDADLQESPIMFSEFDWNQAKEKIVMELNKL